MIALIPVALVTFAYRFTGAIREANYRRYLAPIAFLPMICIPLSGQRLQTTLDLECSDVNLTKRQLRVERNDWRGQVTSTKGNRVRYVRMTQRLVAALQRHRHLRGPRVVCHRDGRPFAEYNLTDLLGKVGRRANVRSNVADRDFPNEFTTCDGASP
jgi:integrase